MAKFLDDKGFHFFFRPSQMFVDNPQSDLAWVPGLFFSGATSGATFAEKSFIERSRAGEES